MVSGGGDNTLGCFGALHCDVTKNKVTVYFQVFFTHFYPYHGKPLRSRTHVQHLCGINHPGSPEKSILNFDPIIIYFFNR